MIIDFSISNYRSIRETQTLSFEATNDKHLEDYYLVKIGKYRLLKIAYILGANASGKSNVLKAFFMFPRLLLYPCKDKSELINYHKFALDESWKDKSSKLSVNFIVGEHRYSYQVEFDNKLVHNELLMRAPVTGGKEHKVYERNTAPENLVSTISWGDKYRSITNTRILSTNLLHNRTLFGAFQLSNVDIPWMKDILDWVDTYFMPLVTAGDQRMTQYISKRIIENKISKQDIINQLKKADVGINDLNVEKKKEPISPEIINAILHDDNAPDELKLRLQEDPTSTTIDIHLSHNGYNGSVPLDYKEESAGTQRYFELTGPLMETIKESHFLAIDELDCRLHPDLYQHFITTFIRNAHQSQMVFTTHMREFLAEKDYYRDDSVWITEKSDFGDTELYSLADFGSNTLRGVSSRYNAYRAGRLGGVPRLGDTSLISFK